MQVVDTNIVVYLLLQGDRTAAARALFARDPDWHSDSFVLVEFCNMLAIMARIRLLPAAQAFGLLTTAERRNRYRELAMLMRQGTPTDEAVNQAFGSSLAEVSKEFEDGRWHHEAQFKIPAPKTTPPVPAAELMDAGQTRTLLQVVADRVAQQPLHP